MEAPSDPEPEVFRPVAPSPQLRPEGGEVIELEVREHGVATTVDRSLAWSAGEAVMSLSLNALSYTGRVAGLVMRRVAASPLGRFTNDIVAGAFDALSKERDTDWEQTTRALEEQLGRFISVVVPVVVQSFDPDEVMERVDVDALLESVDVNAIVGRVDVAALLQRVDVNALLDRMDIDGLLQRIDIDELLSRADVNALLARVDVGALLEDIDVAALAKRAKVGELVAESTGEVAGTTLDLGRRQGVALDTLLARGINRVLGRDPDSMPEGPPDLINSAAEEEE